MELVELQMQTRILRRPSLVSASFPSLQMVCDPQITSHHQTPCPQAPSPGFLHPDFLHFSTPLLSPFITVELWGTLAKKISILESKLTGGRL